MQNNLKIQWINKCKDKIINYKNNYNNMPIIEQLSFIRRQYYNLYSILDVLDGKSELHGIDIDLFKVKKDDGTK
jgi:hypothetical protein